MDKTILLGTKESISTMVSKWMFGILGLIWLGMGILKIYEEGISVASIGYLIIATGFILISILFFTNNPFAPKILISDSQIMIKNDVFRNPKKILWSSIKSVEFDQYLIIFHLEDKDEEVSYNSNAETSLKIKSSIRDVAEKKKIICEN